MPFDYTVEPENQLLAIIGAGCASMEERYDFVNRIMHDRSLDEVRHILINVSDVLNHPAAGEIGAVASLVERLQAKFKGRVAILNTRVGHVTLTNLIAISANCGSDTVRSFLSEKEAREWLCAGRPSSP